MLGKQPHQLLAKGKFLVVDNQRMRRQLGRRERGFTFPLRGPWRQDAQRVIEQRQNGEAAILLDRQGGHRHIKFAIADRLLDRQAAKLGDLQLDARIALAEATDRLGHQHPDHRRNAKPQHPFMQVVDIAQL